MTCDHQGDATNKRYLLEAITMLQQNNDSINPKDLQDCIKGLIHTVDELSSLNRYSKLLDVAITDPFSDDSDFVYVCVETFRANFIGLDPEYALDTLDKTIKLLNTIASQQEPPPKP